MDMCDQSDAFETTSAKRHTTTSFLAVVSFVVSLLFLLETFFFILSYSSFFLDFIWDKIDWHEINSFLWLIYPMLLYSLPAVVLGAFVLFVVCYSVGLFKGKPLMLAGISIAVMAPIGFLYGFFGPMLILLISLCCGIIAIINIWLSGGLVKGKPYAITGAVIPLLFFSLVILAALAKSPRYYSPQLRCGFNLKELGTAIHIHVNDNEGYIPSGEIWCDILIMEAYVSPTAFLCPAADGVEGESTYAMNRYAVGRRLEDLSPDMVLLFETDMGVEEGPRTFPLQDRRYFASVYVKPSGSGQHKKVFPNRWNQVGGPDDLTLEHHNGNGCNILYVGGFVSFVNAAEISTLRWSPED